MKEERKKESKLTAKCDRELLVRSLLLLLMKTFFTLLIELSLSLGEKRRNVLSMLMSPPTVPLDQLLPLACKLLILASLFLPTG